VGARRFPVSRALAVIVTGLVLATMPEPATSQPAPRRLTTIAGIRQFPSYFHLQNILLRGEFTEDAGRISLKSEDGTIRSVLDTGVRTTSGPVEVRAQLIDVGRLDPGDPRVPESEGRDASRWPRPGEELFLRVTGVTPATPAGSISVRDLALEPWRYDGQKVTVTGNFRGRNLFGDLPGAPGKSRYDFVIRGAEGAAWVTGVRPRGRGFDLDIDRRLDTDQWLEVTGVVAYERGLVRIDATELAAAKPPQTLQRADEPAAPPPLFPPLEVVFSSPTPGEIDVARGSAVRIQFSRGIDTRSIGGAIKVSYTGDGGTPPTFRTTYDAATRALTLRFTMPLERFRNVQVEVGETLRAFDGAPTKPWTLTFTVGE
jgi:Big-like domain-containing protein